MAINLRVKIRRKEAGILEGLEMLSHCYSKSRGVHLRVIQIHNIYMQMFSCNKPRGLHDFFLLLIEQRLFLTEGTMISHDRTTEADCYCDKRFGEQ